jgi:hypothetical protein
MTSHPYLRAYLAGIALPTAFLPIGVCAFVLARHTGVFDVALERVVIFPMAAVPNLWGLWNVLYVALRRRGAAFSIGLHGAALPFLLFTCGVLLTRVLGVDIYRPRVVFTAFPFALLAYYLTWKYVVAFFNRLLGVPS